MTIITQWQYRSKQSDNWIDISDEQYYNTCHLAKFEFRQVDKTILTDDENKLIQAIGECHKYIVANKLDKALELIKTIK